MTKSSMDGKGRSQHRSELFWVTSQHHLSSVLHHDVRLKYPRNANQCLRLSGLARLVNENM